jgi:hypothetical protein
MENKTVLPFSAETINALVETMQLVVMSVTQAMTSEQQRTFARNLEVSAERADAQGKTAVASLLRDMHNAAQ